jgi:hypothetical protein
MCEVGGFLSEVAEDSGLLRCDSVPGIRRRFERS